MELVKECKISYSLYGNLYLNITNKCSNNCVFCVRNYTDELEGNYLWLHDEPDVETVVNSVTGDVETIGMPDEIVFCGYGEPFYRPAVMINVIKELKKLYNPVKFRINTNGQGKLINNGKSYLPELSGLVDAISISLNAHNSVLYQKICKSDFGEKAFLSLIDFTEEAKDYIPHITLSVVGKNSFNNAGYSVDIDRCREIASHMAVKFRIR